MEQEVMDQEVMAQLRDSTLRHDDVTNVMSLIDQMVLPVERQCEQTPFLFALRHPKEEKRLIARGAMQPVHTSQKLHFAYQQMKLQWMQPDISLDGAKEFIESTRDTYAPIPEPTVEFTTAVNSVVALLNEQTRSLAASGKTMWLLIYQTNDGIQVFGSGKNCICAPIVSFIHLTLMNQDPVSEEVDFGEAISAASHLLTQTVSEAFKTLSMSESRVRKRRVRKQLKDDAIAVDFANDDDEDHDDDDGEEAYADDEEDAT